MKYLLLNSTQKDAVSGVSVVGHALEPVAHPVTANTWVLPQAVLCDDAHEEHWATLLECDQVYVDTFETARVCHVYVDSVDGSDTNTGLTRAQAVKTLAKMLTIAAAGNIIGLKAGSRFHEKFSSGLAGLRFYRYDAGADPIIDGSLPLAAEDWSADSRADVYSVDVTHIELPPSAGIASSSSAHYCLWYEKAGVVTMLEPYYAGADQATNRDYVRDHVGYFTANVQGSSNKDPRDNDSESDKRALQYWAHFPDGDDPTSSGGVVYYADVKNVFVGADGLEMDGIVVQRNIAKDLVIQADQDSGLIRNCTFRHGALHGWLGSPAQLEYCTVIGRSSSWSFGGGGIHFYRAGDSVGKTAGIVSAKRCSVSGVNIAFYSHGNGATPEHEGPVTIADCSDTGCRTSFQNGQTVRGWSVTRHRSIGSENFIIAETRFEATDSIWVADGAISGFHFGLQSYVGAEIALDNVALVFNDAVASFLRYAWRNNDPSIPFRLTMNGCTVVNASMGTVGAGHAWMNVDLALDDTILGNPSGFIATSAGCFRTLVAANSQFGFGGKSLAQVQALFPSVGSDCIDAASNAAVFNSNPEDSPYDVTLDPTCQPAIRGMGCDPSLLPA